MLSDLANDIRRDARRHGGVGAPLEGVLVEIGEGGRGMRMDSRSGDGVQFPCSLSSLSTDVTGHFISPLTSRDTQMLTAFFVLKPAWFGQGSHAPGQRFFGHFPSGQFRFLNGQASFNSFGADYLLAGGAGDVSKYVNKIILLTYRFGRAMGDRREGEGITIEISVNGKPFEHAGSETRTKTESAKDASELFSADSPLVVGGVQREKCGYMGSMSEVLLFREFLSDRTMASMQQYLLKKYRISLPTLLERPQVMDTVKEGSQQPDKEIVLGRSQEGVRVPALASTIALDRVPPVTTPARISNVDRAAAIDSFITVKDSKATEVWEKKSSTAAVDSQPVVPPSVNLGIDVGVQNSIVSVLEEERGADTSHQRENERDIKPINRVRQEKDSSSLSNTMCAGHIDPFKSQPIENFKPPAKATLQEVTSWEDEVSAMISTVRKMTVGGAKLREYIQKEVRRMQLLRFETFCKYVPAEL